jgi:hypothetical protein
MVIFKYQTDFTLYPKDNNIINNVSQFLSGTVFVDLIKSMFSEVWPRRSPSPVRGNLQVWRDHRRDLCCFALGTDGVDLSVGREAVAHEGKLTLERAEYPLWGGWTVCAAALLSRPPTELGHERLPSVVLVVSAAGQSLPYQLLEVLGTGGFCCVLSAEEEEEGGARCQVQNERV